jgi:alpha-L-fucosidase
MISRISTHSLRLALSLCCPLLFAATPPPTPAAPPDFQWWRDARFGMFIHWGPVSLTGREISWSRAKSNPNSPNNGPTSVAVYDNLYKQFNPVKFNADEWVGIAKAAGMKYIVLTAKHCDGFLLWNSKTIDYNIMHTPFGRDVVAELAAAANKAGIPFCVYFAPGDWKDPDCRNPLTNDRFVQRMHEQLTELLTQYGRIPLVWFDFDGYPNPTDPQQTATLVRTLQPGVLITNRLEALHSDESHGRVGKWGDYATPEQFVGGYCDTVPWETCMTIGRQWSWKSDEKVKSLKECLTILVSTVGGDGNLLFNIGPRADGAIEPDQAARLKEMGDWLGKNGESIHGTRGGPYHPSPIYASTRKAEAIYIHALRLTDGSLTLPPLPASVRSATLLDGTPVPYEQSPRSLKLTIPQGKQDAAITVVKLAVDQPPLSIPAIAPASSTDSLAYRKPVEVSSSIAPLFIHSGASAVDDDPSTWWTPGRNESLANGFAGKKFEHLQKQPTHPVWLHGGWIEVDLGNPRKVSRAVLMERLIPTNYSSVSYWKIEYEQAGQWRPATEGQAIGKSLKVEFPTPHTARKFRLSVQGPGRPAITEFQLFP